jgi:hypothetical protein
MHRQGKEIHEVLKDLAPPGIRVLRHPFLTSDPA